MKMISNKLIIMLFCLTAVVGGCTYYDTIKESVTQSLTQEELVNPVNFYKSDEYSNLNVQRVLLVPFTFDSGREKVVNEVTDAFFDELQKSGKFDVVTPHEYHEVFLNKDNLWVKGMVNAETIVVAKKRYQVDAIIFGTITRYSPYEPPVIGIKSSMFSTTSGNVIWTSDTIFDSSESSIVKLAKAYYKENYQKEQSLYGWKIVLLSSKRYAQFIAHQIVITL